MDGAAGLPRRMETSPENTSKDLRLELDDVPARDLSPNALSETSMRSDWTPMTRTRRIKGENKKRKATSPAYVDSDSEEEVIVPTQTTARGRKLRDRKKNLERETGRVNGSRC